MKRTKYYFMSIIFLALSALIACSGTGQTENDGKFTDVDARGAKTLITDNQNNPQFVILDTRTPAEYEKNHLENSVFYNYSAGDYWDQIRKLDKTKVYLVYCHSGGRSGNTIKFMKDNGFTEAHNLSGGIVAWKRAGFGLVR